MPLQIYMPHARAIDEGLVPEFAQFERVSRRADDHESPDEISVRELVVAAVGWDELVLPQPLPRSFDVVEESGAHGYDFVRFRSDRRVSLRTAELVAADVVALFEP